MGDAIGGSVIGGLFGLGGAAMQSSAASDASDAALQATREATQAQLDMYYQSRADLEPWRSAGTWAINQLAGTPASTGGTATPPAPSPTTSPVATGGQPAQNNGYQTVWVTQPPDYLSAEDRAFWRPYQVQVPVSGNGPILPVNAPTTGTVMQQTPYGGIPTNLGQATQPTQTNAPAAQGQPGTQGLIAKGPGEFIPEEQPGYKFGYQNLVYNPLMNKAAASGMSDSGATLKALTRYASDYASTQYDNFLSRWYQSLNPYFSLAGLGQVSAGQTANLGQATGQGIAQNTMAGGNAQAMGYLNQGNIWGNFASGMGQNALNSYYYNKSNPYSNVISNLDNPNIDWSGF